jgi:hypothetical protein
MSLSPRRRALAGAALLLLLPVPLLPADAGPAGATSAAAPGAVGAEALALAETYREMWGLHPLATLEVVAERRSLTGDHAWLQQRLGDAVVDDGGLAYHRPFDGSAPLVQARLASLPAASPVPSPGLDRAAATALAAALLGGPALRAPPLTELVLAPGGALAWRIGVPTAAPPRDWEVRLDANSGAPLGLRDIRRSLEGVALVWEPNPITSSGNAHLRDNVLGLTSPQMEAELRTVTLHGLSAAVGERGRLVGPHAHVLGAAAEPFLDFRYTRADPRFEEVMAYHHIDQAQRRLQVMGFDLAAQRIPVHNYPGEVNAFYSRLTVSIHFGWHARDTIERPDGGLADAAEDGDIVVHEYGHAVLDDLVPALAGTAGEAIHEGFADFLAAALLHGEGTHFRACVAPWFGQYVDPSSLARPTCLRSLDHERRFPDHFAQGLLASPHTNGLIWGGALWDLAEAHGSQQALRVGLEAHFYLATIPRMDDLGPAVLRANRLLGAPLPEASVEGILAARGLLGPAPLPQDDAGSGTDAGNHHGAALPVAPGDHAGVVGGPGDREDWYAIALRAGDFLVLDYDPSTSGTPGFAPPTDPPYLGQQAGNALRLANPAFRATGPAWGCDTGVRDLRFVLRATQGGDWRFWVPERPGNDPADPQESPYAFRYRVVRDAAALAPEAGAEVVPGTVFADAQDSVYARLDGAGSLQVVAPSGRAMTIGKEAGPGVLVAHVALDGRVLGVRVLTGTANAITVQGSLAGEPADGTWYVRKALHENSGQPLGYQLRVQGKVLDDVATPGDPIEGHGTATTAAMLTPLAAWNWHKSPDRFDAAGGDAVVPRPPVSPVCPRLLQG